MAVRIRLQRHGAKHNPTYRLVAAESTKPRDGRFIEILGSYHPKARGAQKEIEIKLERIDYWINVGAQPTETARSLIKKARRATSSDGQVVSPKNKKETKQPSVESVSPEVPLEEQEKPSVSN